MSSFMKVLLKIAGAIVLLIVLVVLIVLGALLLGRNPNGYVDFTRFAVAADLKSYLESKLVTGQSTLADVQRFLDAEGIHRCTDRPTSFKPTSEADTAIICWTLAPNDFDEDDGWFVRFVLSSMFPRKYTITFLLKNDVLIGIEVRR